MTYICYRCRREVSKRTVRYCGVTKSECYYCVWCDLWLSVVKEERVDGV